MALTHEPQMFKKERLYVSVLSLVLQQLQKLMSKYDFLCLSSRHQSQDTTGHLSYLRFCRPLQGWIDESLNTVNLIPSVSLLPSKVELYIVTRAPVYDP